MLIPYAEIFIVLSLWVVAVLTPGPNLLVTMEASLQHSKHAGLAVAFGITIGTLILIAVSLMGIGALYHANPNVKSFFTLFASGFLFYLAYKKLVELISAKKKINSINLNPLKNNSMVSCIIKGLIVDVSNPQALLFFLAIFSTIQSDEFSLSIKAGLATFIIIMTFVYYGGMAVLASHPKLQSSPKGKKAFSILSMCLFVVFGITLLIMNFNN